MPDAIILRDVRKDYGSKTVLHISSFTLRHGGFAAFIGPNGAGKSTFLKLIAGLLKPTKAEQLEVLGQI